MLTMYEVPPCPCCYLGDYPAKMIVCVTCKKAKLPMPDGRWQGDWWYCSTACASTPWPRGEWCPPHCKRLETIKAEYPELFK